MGEGELVSTIATNQYMGANKLQTFLFGRYIKMDHCLPSQSDGGSPHKDGSFMSDTGKELPVIKGKDWDVIQ